jgi:hypothetical protein
VGDTASVFTEKVGIARRTGLLQPFHLDYGRARRYRALAVAKHFTFFTVVDGTGIRVGTQKDACTPSAEIKDEGGYLAGEQCGDESGKMRGSKVKKLARLAIKR